MNERAEVLLSHPELDESDVTIVWLTAPALKNAPKRDDEEEDDDDYFAPCEAVMIDSPEFTEWLVKVI